MLLLAFAAVIGPLIEEAVKPLAVWFLGRRLHSPGEGFALGALSGAGFALLEGLMASSGYASQPVFGLPARLASSMMHITLSAFMGWAIASAFLEKRWVRLVVSYLLCATMHGLWNGSALLAVYGALRFSITGAAMPDLLSSLFMLVGVFMLFITFVSITLSLPLMNLRLRKLQGDIIAQPKNQIERMKDGVDPQSS